MRHIEVPTVLRQAARAAAVLANAVLPTATAQSPVAETTHSLRSYATQQSDWSLVQLPSRSAERRGALAKGAPFTVFNEFTAPGCKAAWWQVGADAWMCPDNASITDSSSRSGEKNPAEANSAVRGYVVVGKNGALGYTRREDVDVSTPNAEMQRGFMLAFTRLSGTGDTATLLTTHNLWIAARDVQILSPSNFQGTPLDGELDVAWVFAKRVQVFASPDNRQQPPRFLERLTRVSIQGQQQRKSGLWIKSDAGWIKSTDLRIPELQQPPKGVGADERWIDVDTTSQTLVAYVGARPVFATLVSTGKGKPATEQATPVGVHRVWIKLPQSDMDNLENADSQSVYAVEAVPHVLFFEGGYGIHGTYWHDEFGLPKSHGCVNVSLADADWLFQFAGPHLPSGWSAVFPTAREPGTVVNVR